MVIELPLVFWYSRALASYCAARFHTILIYFLLNSISLQGYIHVCVEGRGNLCVDSNNSTHLANKRLQESPIFQLQLFSSLSTRDGNVSLPIFLSKKSNRRTSKPYFSCHKHRCSSGYAFRQLGV